MKFNELSVIYIKWKSSFSLKRFIENMKISQQKKIS